nr:MAG TPA: hypothetical protein [Caudoviricetes sp.]
MYQQSKIETTSIFQLSNGSWIFYCKKIRKGEE